MAKNLPALPDHVSNQMVAVFDHVDNAIKQLEAFAAQFDVILYRDGTDKYEYVHDFTLMLAIGDLDSITLALSDSSGTDHVEHVVNMRLEEERGNSPLLGFFKKAVEAGSEPKPSRDNFPPLTDGAFSYRSQGKGLIDEYRQFFAVKWTTVDSDGPRGPVSTTKSNWDESVPEPSRIQRQLTDYQLALPNYADAQGLDDILALPHFSD